MKNIKKKLITGIIFICSLFFSINHNLDVNAQEVNEMGSFPSVITLVKEQIVKVSFIKDSQVNIDTRFNAAPIKADLTSGEGSVKGWLEVSSSDSSKYELFVGSAGTTYLTTAYQLFKGWSNVQEINFNNIKTSKTNHMFEMFYDCTNLKSLDLSSFNTSNVTYMAYMFYGCENLTSINLKSFNTSKVTSMRSMFAACHSLLSLDASGFDTSNVTKMNGMFYNCINLTSLDVSNFNTRKVTDMTFMFSGCSKLTSLDLSNFDTSNATDMSAMFQHCRNLTSLNLTSFDTSKVTDMSTMFSNCSKLTSLDLSNFDTSNATDMSAMFQNCNNLISVNLSSFDTSKVTDMSNMFYYCSKLTSLDVSKFNTIKVTDMAGMFYNCKSLTSLDVSNFNTSNVTKVSSMFAGIDKIAYIDISKWDTSKMTDLSTIGLPQMWINTLKTLTVSSGTLSFDSGKLNYTIYVDASIKQITINSTLMNPDSKYVSGYGNRTITLDNDSTSASIKVEAPNGNVKTYTLDIIKKSGVNTLKTLTLSSGVINFSSDTTVYDIFVDSSVSSIIISSTLTDEKSTYVSGYGNRTVNLNVGLNTILIKVQAQTGEVRTYTLNITRKSNVNTLKTLTLSTGTINFNPNTLSYNVTVDNNVSSITITSTLTDSKSKYVSGYGNREVSLKEGLNAILIKVQAESGDVKTYTLNITRKSNVNTLKTLTLSTGTINFNPNTLSYNVTVDNNVSSITISSTLTDSKSKYVSGYGNRSVNLNEGLNTILIKVQSESGSVRTYTLNITRTPKSTVNTLKTLTLSKGTLNFNPNTLSYNVTVDNSVTSITISSTLTDSKSTYVSGYGNRSVNLSEGSNTVLLKVKAENGDIKTYILNITRTPKNSTNALKTLTLSKGTLNFNPNTLSYNVTVDNNVTSITITSTLSDSKSTYVSGYGNRTVNLNVGLNNILIKVKAENGDIRTYAINVTRKSNVNTLKTLTLSSGTISFSPNTLNYNVTVDNSVSSITITSTLTDSKSTYVSGYGNRNVNLNEGLNIVTIKVKSENGEVKTYTLNITRKTNVNTLKTLTLSKGTINFNPNTFNYNVTVDNSVTSITISSTLTDSKSTYVSGYGNRTINLNVGVNIALIKVKSENGEIKTYTLNITRKSNVNTLKTLTLSSGRINFNPNTLTYDVKVGNSVTNITVNSTLTDLKSTYVSGYGNRTINLKEGLNTVAIKVQSENGDIKTYTLNISRENKVSALKTLTLSSGKINFDPNVIDYNVTVNNDIAKITISSTLTDSASTYVSGYGNREVSLKEGLNKVLIKVKTENGEIITYTLNITRKYKTNSNDNNADIKYLTIENYSINFNSNKTEYSLKIKNEERLNIQISLVNKNSTYEILNNNNLKDGSVIIIEVTSPDKSKVKAYKINIEKEEIADLPSQDNKKENNKSNTYIAIAVLTFGVISFLCALNYRRKIR